MHPKDQSAFWEQMRTYRTNDAPLCCDGEVETVHEIRPGRRIPWVIVIITMTSIGFLLAMLGYAVASEPPKGVAFVIWNETTDKQAHVHQFTSPTACNTDLGGVAKTMPDGSRLSCRRIDQRKEQ